MTEESRIGKGSFTVAYEKNPRVVSLKSVDPIKKLLSKKKFNNPMVPNVKHVGTEEKYEIYEMVRLNVIGKDDNMRFLNKRSRAFFEKYSCCLTTGYKETMKLIKGMKDFPMEQRALLEIMSAVKGSDVAYLFEVYEQNIAVHKRTGNLIFFDMLMPQGVKYIDI